MRIFSYKDHDEFGSTIQTLKNEDIDPSMGQSGLCIVPPHSILCMCIYIYICALKNRHGVVINFVGIYLSKL